MTWAARRWIFLMVALSCRRLYLCSLYRERAKLSTRGIVASSTATMLVVTSGGMLQLPK